MVLLSAQGMDAAAIAKVAFTSEDRVRDVIRNFNADGFDSLYLKYRGGRRSSPPGRAPRPRMRATCTRTQGVRHLLAAYELGEDRMHGQIKPRKNRARFVEFCRYLRTLYPPQVRIAIICDNYSPHLTTAKNSRVGDWAAANNVDIVCTPAKPSWLNRIETQFIALHCFALDGTDHASHREEASMIRRSIIWRNNHAYDERLRQVVARVKRSLRRHLCLNGKSRGLQPSSPS